jgi:DNA (cytosine-5)-methyltransferase 1
MDKFEFSFIDLFAGIGGMRIAFEKVGGFCSFSSEWDKFAQQTYESNFKEKPNGDITKIKSKEIPEHEILVAGFPCQPFSNAGVKLGFNDMRGTLFFDIIRIARYRKPSMMLLENVKGLKSHDKGHTFSVILYSLNKIGYDVFYKVLNAKNFGLPQNRERIYIVCVNRKKLGKIEFKFPESISKNVKLGDILQDNVEPKYTISNKLWSGHKRRLRQHKQKGNGFGYSLFNSKSSYTSTLSARYYKDGSEILIEQNGKNPRKITPREAARLQGFSDKFKIPVSDNQAYKQFGNSVAIPVVHAIAKTMLMHLKAANDKKP